MSTKQKITAYIYLRYSSEMQNYMSIEAQRRAVKVYCKTHNIQIIAEYVDEAKSATTDKRPQFQKMMEDIQYNDIDMVVVHKFDRFSRNTMDSLKYRALLEKFGVKLVSVIEPIDDSPESKLLELMLCGMSEFYSSNLGREVQKGKKEAAHHKKFLGGVPPLGYDVDDDKNFIINPTESNAVRLFFEMYVNDYSYNQIASKLNELGYRTKKGQLFNRNSFISLIENAEMYTGVYMYNKAAPKRIDGKRNSHKRKAENDIIRIPDESLRIISDNLYNIVLDKRKQNKSGVALFKSRRYYILNSKIKCGVCGKSFSGNTSKSGRNKKEYKTYRCNNYRNSECDNKAINTKYLDKFVINKISKIIFKKNTIQKLISDLNRKMNTIKDNKNSIISLKNKLMHIRAKIDNLTTALSKNYSSNIQNAITSLELQEKQIVAEIEKLNNDKPMKISIEDIIPIRRKLISYLHNKDTIACRALIRDFVREIIIEKDQIIITLKTEN